MSNLIEVKVPDIGDFDEVDVIEVLVAEGDRIEEDQSLITVESDKASMEIPSSAAGIVKSLKVKVGDKVSEGTVLLELEPDAGAASASEPSATAENKASTETAADTSASVAAASASAAPADASGGVVQVVVPDIGDFDEVDVIEVLVNEGDTVQEEQSLITVESDKASMEIPSSHAGRVVALRVKVGDKVAKGSLILELAAAGGSEAAAPVASTVAPTPAAAEPTAVKAPTEATHAYPIQRAELGDDRESPTASYALSAQEFRNLPHASPSVRKFARELGVDLTAVNGTGSRGRIVLDDVRQFVKNALSVGFSQPSATTETKAVAGGGLQVLDWPKIDFAKFGEVETQPLSRIKKISGANLHRNWVMIPHVTNNDKADITELEEFRKLMNKEHEREGVRFTMLAFLIKAVVATLKKFPEFNASLDGDNLVLKKYYHIGFAADTPNGLVVPVLRDADQKSIVEIAIEMNELAKSAREGKLSPSQMQGGCFTISSLGGIGGTDFTPIINAPEVAILGVSRSAIEPVWNGKEFIPRLMLPLSLSYDHRVIDGAAAARFNAHLAKLMSDFRRVSL
ncbi:dihydrolipoyllysine-residue acetyltransferase [Oligella urethralis]|uniref:Acetyltransferase component of pyruvate dehydrogenase complex n=1 Tax=Oligella urethralis DNF00040 TaxID=1401065 RepID=A0A096BH81_9BURK|nr:dihydrolipoyllysine-residue acetyltransferase [Oligella urethralis]KGF32484.1 dihydrolipoamide acetyltransferase [Oligella urethralis DNF00040]PMC17868.1 dihydrolipoyllysine-residue acetyltransferase [Oligella urethralis]SUA67112.1 Dihydrolipoyllysine-residue acetyltransferase component of pyruvate dehydrogenase complex [Oligella urethralis]